MQDAPAPAWWRFYRTYRPYVALVAAIALAVLLPRVSDDATPTTQSTAGGVGGPGGSAVAAGAAGDPGTGGVATGADGTGGGAGAPGTVAGGGPAPADGGGAAGGAAGAGGAAAAAAKAGAPGVGSPEALANPECDPATGRIRFPSLFAPECVVPWPEGADNGGATSQGVTADTIKIVLYETPNPQQDNPTSPDVATRERQAKATLLAFANSYELWGRKLEIIFHRYTGTDEAAQRADAIDVYNKYKPFIATSFMNIGAFTPLVWATEMAARGVISWDEVVPFDQAQAQAGFRWGYNPDDRMSALQLGEYVGKRLKGRPAKNAGDPALKVQERKFGLVYDDVWDKPAFEKVLSQYGTTLADAVAFKDTSDTAAMQQAANTLVARLKSKGVNNVIVVAGPQMTGALTKAATSQSFRPEWTISGWKLQDTAITARLFIDQNQWGAAFGIGLVPPLEQPTEISERSQIYEWAYGGQPEDDATNGQIYLLAKSIMAGIHLAGPNLTPETFRNALFGMQPKGGRWCGCVTHNGSSFGRHLKDYPWDKYFDIDDMTEKWWNPRSVGQDEVGLPGPGQYWVVDGGKRFALGDWPTTEPDVFNESSSRPGYEETPPNDRWPQYPPPKR